MINGELRPTFLAERAPSLRARVSLSDLTEAVRQWIYLAAWLDERGLTSLAQCNTAVWTAYDQRLLAAGSSRVVDLQWATGMCAVSPFGLGLSRLGVVALGGSGAQGLGLAAAGGAAPWAVAVECDGVGPGGEFALVDVGELEGQEDGLGGDAPDAAGSGFFEAFAEGVLGVAVDAFDAVAEPEVDALPRFGAVLERLPEVGAGFGRDGDGALGAALG